MDFRLNEEQQMLRDSARKYLEAECEFGSRGKVIEAGSFDAARWQSFAELGWLGLCVPEQHGGIGASMAEATIVMEELGRVLCVEPYWAIAGLAAQTILGSGDEPKAAALLPGLATGDIRCVLAHDEAGGGASIEHVATTAVPAPNGGWRLSGAKVAVVGGNIADRFIVSARTSGELLDEQGITLFIIPADAPGLRVRPYRLVDNRWGAHVDLDDVAVGQGEVLGKVGSGFAALELANHRGVIGLCAEAVGVMEKAMWLTRDYLTVRKQFGVTLSTFQALQHRMAEMLIEVELSRVMVQRALAHLNLSRSERQAAISAMKVQVGTSGKFVCGQAIQLHGGIGVTEECAIGHYFKRMTMIEYAMGNSHQHLERLAQSERELAA
jgi:alkylation response protein AidB-like acyl-CoA dehydrogenase